MTTTDKLSPSSLPKTMKVAIATGFGDIDANVHIDNGWPVPAVHTKKDELLVQVLACALAPGDCRVLSGKTDWIQLPKGGHPYIMGGDVSGRVVVSKSSKFKPGDYVVSRFELPGPWGGLAEYKVVKESFTEHCPKSIDPITACGLTASTMAGKKIVAQTVKPGDRVLVIGGSGGVGSSVLQYAKIHGASFIAAVSTQEKLCQALGADRVIDYRKEKWWEIPEFQAEPFDVVVDMVSEGDWEKGGRHCRGISRKGTYVVLPPGVQSEVSVHGLWDILSLTFQWVWMGLWTRLNPRVPKCVMPDGLDLQNGDLSGMLKDVAGGKIKPVLDPASPFHFDELEVRDAICLQKSCHAHGKVVVKITDQDGL